MNHVVSSNIIRISLRAQWRFISFSNSETGQTLVPLRTVLKLTSRLVVAGLRSLLMHCESYRGMAWRI